VISQDCHTIEVRPQALEAQISQRVIELEVHHTSTGLHLAETTLSLDISPSRTTVQVQERPYLIEIAAGVPGPPGPPGQGAEWGSLTGDINEQHDLQQLLDQKADSVELDDYFLINNRFSELQTTVEKKEAQTNLGLNVIDGGSFT